MDRRFEPRKREIAAQAEVRPEVFEGMLERLKEFARLYRWKSRNRLVPLRLEAKT